MPRFLATLLILAWSSGFATEGGRAVGAEPRFTPQASGTQARLRGLSVVSAEVAWASGAGGTCLRTIDGGKTWVARSVPDSARLDFRDVHAVDARTAFLLSIGEGESSRIYKTVDGGASWTRPFTNRDPSGFLDALAFWDADHGLALGDPVGGRFVIVTTDDGGKTWNPLPPVRMPPALKGEGAFAASGTCLVVQGDRHAWFGTGGAKHSRVFRSSDRGQTWTVHDTPVRAGSASAGIFSLAFRDADHGVAVGGDYKSPEDRGGFIALTADGGRSWRGPKGRPPRGYRSAVAFVPGIPGGRLLTVGVQGADASEDGGENWGPLEARGAHSLGLVAPGVGWLVGEDGSIVRIETEVGNRADLEHSAPVDHP